MSYLENLIKVDSEVFIKYQISSAETPDLKSKGI
jgi:hypothetical protein